MTSMADIHELFKESIAEFMENRLEAELDEELGYSKYDYKNKNTDNSRNGHGSKTLRTSFGEVPLAFPAVLMSFHTFILLQKASLDSVPWFVFYLFWLPYCYSPLFFANFFKKLFEIP